MGKKKVGNYILDLDDVLGKGQFGKVVRALQVNTENQVAVKIIDKKKINEDQYTRNALVREVEIMKNLKSPHIIECYQVHETPNNVYIVSQLAKHETLKEFIDKKKPFSEHEALVYIMQILTGFAQLVKNGIIHRDVKPTNILMSEGLLKLADFGFAKNTKNLSYMQSVVGTPAYMAPQVLSRQIFENYSYKCDIWSFGVVCYEILVGKLPWSIKSNNIKQLFKEIKEQAISGVKFPENLQISKDVKDMIRGCLKYEEMDRYDWNTLFGHSAFKNQKKFFDDNFSIEEAFTKTHLRMCIHSQNINLRKLFEGMPKNIKKDDFILILKGIDSQISVEQIMLIFKSISSSEEVSQQNIIGYFKDHHIKVGKKKMNKTEEESNLNKLVEGLTIAMEEKDIDTYDLFRKYDTKKKNSLKEDDFNKLLLSLNPKLGKEELTELFTTFDSNGNKEVEFNQFYSIICKIGEVMKVEDDQLHESLRKLKKK